MSEFVAQVSQWIETELVPKLVKEGVLVPATSSPVLENVKATPLTVTGFALCTPFRVCVNLRCDSKSTRLNLVVKRTPPLPEEMYKGAKFDILFRNETVAYKEIIPVLNQASKYPRFFYSDIQPLDAVLVMDDFSQYGWKMSNNIYNLSLDHIVCAVKELGQFHGECYVLKETKPDVFNGIVSKMREARYADFHDGWGIVLKAIVQRAVEAAKKRFGNELPETFLAAVQSRLGEPGQFGMDSIKPVEPLAVITHGDYLRNNIAFRYENDDPTQKPIEAMMFDMQTMRYCSPMLDLATLMANSVTHELRTPTHLSTILRTYHQALLGVLTKGLGNNVPDCYSFEHFEREYAERFIYGLHISAGFLPILHESLDMEDVFKDHPPMEEVAKVVYKMGGEAVDIELSHQVREIYEFTQKYGFQV